MTHAEYEKARVALIHRHLRDSYWSGARGAPPDEVLDSLAPQLADALDRLVLEIDPFEAKPAGARAKGGNADRR